LGLEGPDFLAVRSLTMNLVCNLLQTQGNR